jgi:hypothetical protein
MEPNAGFWHEVGRTAYLLDPDGETIWRVEAERPGEVLLVQRDGTRRVVRRPDPFTPVTFMRRTQEECEQMIAEQLGATLAARRDPGFKMYDCPSATATTLRAHLLLFHAVYVGDIKGAKNLTEAHDNLHADFDAGHELHGHVPHRHLSNIRPLGATA